MIRVGVLAAMLVACSREPPEPPPSSGSAMSAPDPLADPEATKTYGLFCAPCHGADLKGYKADRAPSLVNPTFLESATDSFLIDSIEQGRPGTSMAAYVKAVGGPLDPATIRKVVTWIRAHGRPTRALAKAPPGGDATRGQRIYASACMKCHGTAVVKGDFMSLANPRFLASASDAFIAHAILYGRPDTPMVPWQGKLSTQDIADVIAYVRSLQRPASITRMAPPTGKEPLFENPGGKPPRFVGHSEPCPHDNPSCKPDPRFVPVDQVKAALDRGQKLVIIDARVESEWMVSHIHGAVSIPYADMKRLAEIPKDAWIVAYCACPHHLSGLVVDELVRRGYPHAFVLDEGINEWLRRGYPRDGVQ